MIDKKKIETLVKEKLDNGFYLVDVTVSKTNIVHIYIDSFEGVSIEKCVEMSRYVEQNFDREVEDFELQVSSPGLTHDFKIPQQFIKYIDKKVQVDTKENKRLQGIITQADENGFTFATTVLEKIEGKKKKEEVEKVYDFKYEDINSAKPIISFK